jgi:hypothetical protein
MYKIRIAKALEIAKRYGSIDGSHHKMWVIDQMIRALTECPINIKERKDNSGSIFFFYEQIPSEEYKKFVQNHNAGEDGPNSYSWEEGIAP